MDMKKHGTKMVAPIVITVCFLIYLVFWIGGMLFTPLPPLLKVGALAVPAAAAGAFVYVLVERIKEIEGGEEDDLSKY